MQRHIKIVTTILLMFTSSQILLAQVENVIQNPTSIRTDGVNPDPSAMLDIQSTSKGVLVPRMTSTQRNGISSPAQGLLVFDLTTGSFWYFDSSWQELGAGGSSSSTMLIDSDGDTRLTVEETPDEDILRLYVRDNQIMTIGNGNLSSFAAGSGSNIASASHSFIGGGASNTASENYAFVGGGLSNTSSERYSFVGGGTRNKAEGESSFVGGGDLNFARGIHSFVGGGDGNITDAQNAFIAGGNDNYISGNFSFIGGSRDSNISSSDGFIGGGFQNSISGGIQSFIGGGAFNIANNSSTFIGGGNNNAVSGDASFIGGGLTNNITSLTSSIVGGRSNSVSGQNGSIAGGDNNSVSGLNSFIGGGIDNFALDNGSFVGGGNTNIASGLYSTIIGGTNNTASGLGASISGGGLNTAAGTNSWSMGSLNSAMGINGIAAGLNNTAASYSEVVIGTNALLYMPNSDISFDNNDRVFTVGNGMSSSNRSNALTVLKNGNIGIEEDEPEVPLHITGGTDVEVGSGGYLQLGSTNGLNVNIDNNEIVARNNGSYAELLLNHKGGDVVIGRFGSDDVGIGRSPTTNDLEVNGTASKSSAGDWLANSDARLKKNIQSLDSKEVLQQLLQLQGITYEWNDQVTENERPEGIQYGFTAQNIQKVFPELVSEDADGYLQTAYGTYDAMYIEAIRALVNQNKVLQAKVQQLETAQASQLQEQAQLIQQLQVNMNKLQQDRSIPATSTMATDRK